MGVNLIKKQTFNVNKLKRVFAQSILAMSAAICLTSMSYYRKTTTQSIQFSLQALINKGLVEKGKFRARGDDGYQHSTFGLTVIGRASLKLMVA